MPTPTQQELKLLLAKELPELIYIDEQSHEGEEDGQSVTIQLEPVFYWKTENTGEDWLNGMLVLITDREWDWVVWKLWYNWEMLDTTEAGMLFFATDTWQKKAEYYLEVKGIEL